MSLLKKTKFLTFSVVHCFYHSGLIIPLTIYPDTALAFILDLFDISINQTTNILSQRNKMTRKQVMEKYDSLKERCSFINETNIQRDTVVLAHDVRKELYKQKIVGSS